MKVHLMFRDGEFDASGELPWNAPALMADLSLQGIVSQMSLGDAFTAGVAERALLDSLTTVDAILYRQAVLRDCIEHEWVVRDLYKIANNALEAERKSFWFGAPERHPGSVLYRARELLDGLLAVLHQLRELADASAAQFASDGFSAMFTGVQEELDDAYLAAIAGHLRELKFQRGVFVSARLGEGNKGIAYVLRRADPKLHQSWFQRALGVGSDNCRSFQLSPRDEEGARALDRLRDIAINSVADVAAQCADHVLSFFQRLRTELAFYLGCLNLRTRLMALGMPLTFPHPAALHERRHNASDLYDAFLSLTMSAAVVGNEVRADGKTLCIMTGANQGGKSTLLRAIGQAQLMMQCGMFVPANSFTANISTHIFTHFKREEDPTMQSGKLDEELHRASEIVEHVTPNALVLFNESFAATNEREGSEIAAQIALGLLEAQAKLFFVTHSYEFASGMQRTDIPVLFLRAERLPDGERTFKLMPGEPLPTSHGRDIYETIFGEHEAVE